MGHQLCTEWYLQLGLPNKILNKHCNPPNKLYQLFNPSHKHNTKPYAKAFRANENWVSTVYKPIINELEFGREQFDLLTSTSIHRWQNWSKTDFSSGVQYFNSLWSCYIYMSNLSKLSCIGLGWYCFDHWFIIKSDESELNNVGQWDPLAMLNSSYPEIP